MVRPTTQLTLLNAAHQQFETLITLIDSMPEAEQQALFLFEDRDKNLRDILVHLYEWHQLLLNWVAANQKGQAYPFLPSPYSWKTYPEMNVKFWEKHQSTDYLLSKDMLKESHHQVMLLIESFSNDELFVKKYFSWTGTTSLGSYCVSATSSHYDWAIKKIKKQIKLYRAQ